MNFGREVKEEIISKPIKENCCKRAFLTGFLRGASSIFYENEQTGFEFSVGSEEALLFMDNLFKVLFNCEIREVRSGKSSHGNGDSFTVSFKGEKAIDILSKLNIIYEFEEDYAVNFGLTGEITEKECCFRSLIKGLFYAVGSVSIPSNGTNGYHLEMTFSHVETASETLNALFRNGIKAKITRRKGRLVLYIKSAEEIKNFLAYIGVPVSVCKLTDLIINREIVNDSTRRMNCDLGNVNRIIEASEKQIEAIKKLKKSGEFSTLKEELKLTATCRLNNPDESLVDLANKLKISKSCLNHRLRKLVELAKEKKGE